ncbi:MAG: glycoside hydrolase family 2 TIM barrel-domain containing protein [Candidatus Omnitrophota bacterium]
MKTCLDSDWKFHLGDIPVVLPVIKTYGFVKAGAALGASDPKFDDQNWRRLDLPHDWVVEGQITPEGNRDQGFLPRGIAWYRKVFTLNLREFIPPTSPPPKGGDPNVKLGGRMKEGVNLVPEAEGKKVYLEFEGVSRNATVWLNGFRLGNHPSGYTGFFYDVSDVVSPEGGENTLVVKVDGTEMEGWWYEGCGIYRHVWLIVKERVHLEHWGVFVSTPKVSRKKAQVLIQTEVRNEEDTEQEVELKQTIKYFDVGVGSLFTTHRDRFIRPAGLINQAPTGGAKVAEETMSLKLKAGESKKVKQKIVLENPKLWSPDSPHLYRVQTQLSQGVRVLDSEDSPLGIRRFKFTPNRGFLLNGKPVKIKGTCNHQDFAGVGVALPDCLHYKKIEHLKEMGSNGYRCSHNPPAPALLDACDRLGMLVMDENRKLDSSEEGIRDLRSLVRRDRNHPSIILWSLENEETLEGTGVGTKILRSLYNVVKEEDPTRPITAAVSHDWNEAGYADVLDVVGYNYSPQRYLEDHQKYPERKMVGSETTSAVETRGVYETNDGYCTCYDKETPAWGSTHQAAWKAVAENKFMAGGFVWTGFDYRGEPSPYDWPDISSHFGIMDTCGFPKDAYYYYLSVWTDKPMVHILPHWNWPGKEGQAIPVWCYSNCDYVELFLNDKSLGKKKSVPGGYVEWPVSYQPGELRVLGYKEGKEACSKSVKTAGTPSRISLEPNRQMLDADGCDVALIKSAVLDKDGILVPTAGNKITFKVEGSGRLLGLGNGDPKDHQGDKEDNRRVFNGLCLALVQAGKEPGALTLTAEAEGLQSAKIKLEVITSSSS